MQETITGLKSCPRKEEKKKKRKAEEGVVQKSDVRFSQSVTYSAGTGMGLIVPQGHIFLSFASGEEARKE